jgi:DNA-binding MarR family transcriptional regulator
MRKPATSPSIPGLGEGQRGEAGHLGYLLRQASLAWRARMEHALAEFAVTPPQFAALTMIGAYPGLSSADLARLSLLTPATVAGIVANLKRAGALTARRHPVHGRILQLALTAKGNAQLARCKRRVYSLEARLAEDLSPAEEKAVRRWLALAARAG